MKLHVCNSCHSVTLREYPICLICGNDPRNNTSYDDIRKGYNRYINWTRVVASFLWVFFYFASIANPMLYGSSLCFAVLLVFSFLAPIAVDYYFSRSIEKINKNQMLKIVMSPILSLQNVVLPNDLEANELESKLDSPINKSRIVQETQKKYKMHVLVKIMMNNIKLIIEHNNGNIADYKNILQESLKFCEEFENDLNKYLGVERVNEIESIIYKLRLYIAMDHINNARIDKNSLEILSLIEEVMKSVDYKEALYKL